MIAARAMVPRTPPSVGLDHLHVPQVSVREQALLIVERLRRDGMCSFRALVADADATMVIVARFLALLELYKDAAVAFEQAHALGELTVRWTGTQDPADTTWVPAAGSEFDEGAADGAGAPQQPGGPDD